MNDERPCIGQGRVMFRSQPDLKMGERAVPINYLNKEGKGKANDMENFYYPIFHSPKRPEEEKDDPEKMDQDHAICKNLINHFSPIRLREAPPLKAGCRSAAQGEPRASPSLQAGESRGSLGHSPHPLPTAGRHPSPRGGEGKVASTRNRGEGADESLSGWRAPFSLWLSGATRLL